MVDGGERSPRKVVIYGSRPDGHAKVVVAMLADDPRFELCGLIDDFPENRDRAIGELRVLGGLTDLPRLRLEGVEAVVLGFGEAIGRRRIRDTISESGLKLQTVIARNAHISRGATIGTGAQILVGAFVGPDAHVGQAALLNTCAVAEHDVVIGEGAVIGPAATLTGRAAIGAEANIGAGAIVLPDRTSAWVPGRWSAREPSSRATCLLAQSHTECPRVEGSSEPPAPSGAE